jgi:membrane-associated phospholipid phosphatase
VFATTFVLAAGPPDKTCSWCATNAFDEAVRDALRASNPRTAGALSHAFSTGAAPALALGALVPTAFMSGHPSYALEDVVITLDATIVTFGLTNGTKRLVARSRPAVQHGVVAETEYGDKPSEWNQSFFSADTALAFALVSSATTLSYLRGYRSAPWVLFAGSVIGVSTALLRVAADVHYATDVLTGAAVGTAVGFSLPYFLHRRGGETGPRAFTVLPLVGRSETGVMVVGEL